MGPGRDLAQQPPHATAPWHPSCATTTAADPTPHSATGHPSAAFTKTEGRTASAGADGLIERRSSATSQTPASPSSGSTLREKQERRRVAREPAWRPRTGVLPMRSSETPARRASSSEALPGPPTARAARGLRHRRPKHLLVGLRPRPARPHALGDALDRVRKDLRKLALKLPPTVRRGCDRR